MENGVASTTDKLSGPHTPDTEMLTCGGRGSLDFHLGEVQVLADRRYILNCLQVQNIITSDEKYFKNFECVAPHPP